MIQTIKYKADIIKAEEEDWKVFELVCQALILEDNAEEKNKLKYKKYSHLDLENLKSLIYTGKKWVKFPRSILAKCPNLEYFNAVESNIKELKRL